MAAAGAGWALPAEAARFVEAAGGIAWPPCGSATPGDAGRAGLDDPGAGARGATTAGAGLDAPGGMAGMAGVPGDAAGACCALGMV